RQAARAHLDGHERRLGLHEAPEEPSSSVPQATVQATSTNVTLLISCSVVLPPRALFTADSRRKIIPSSRAARLMSALLFREMITSRTLSDTSRTSQIAVRPW